MIITEQIEIQSIAIHNVGNKLNDEGSRFSKSLLKTDESINELLLTYFFSPFKSNEYYNLFHESDLKLNEVYSFVSEIFDNPDSLLEQSVNLAKHLYEQSVHPKIKGGEMYVVYFRDCIVDGETVDAVGLFKSETKETYLKVYPQNDGFSIESQAGINIHKLDKGCLVFNTEREKGYLVSVVDNLNKGGEAQYWIDHFLHVTQRNDEYFQTKNILSLCKNFVVEKFPEQFAVSKADQAELLNKSVKFFKENDNFDMEDFTNQVIQSPDVISSFKSYKTEFEVDNNFQLTDNFNISDAAVKKQSKFFKSVIKLDKNFHIYVHGDSQQIVKGFDKSSGMNYYQLFFKEES
ncbi:MAG: nucleoid-associated protein [Bacteroidota bacterium]